MARRRPGCAWALSIFILGALLTRNLGGIAPSVRIAFLDKREVWVLSVGSNAPQRQTRTSARVENFRFSDDAKYLAYSRRLRPGDGRWICSIVIVNAATGGLIREIRPKDGWIDIDKWFGSTLLYHASAAMEVSGFFEFDAARRTGRELEPNAGAHTIDHDMAPDGSLLAYVDDIGLGLTFEERLHLVDVPTSADTVQVSKRSVMAPAISPTKDAVAFVEVVDQPSQARDRVWVYRRNDRRADIIDDDVVMPKSGSGLASSPDSRYVLVNFGGRVKVLDVTGTLGPRQTFRGVDACWSDASTVVVGSNAGLDAIDVVTGVRQPLIASGTRPQCFYRVG